MSPQFDLNWTSPRLRLLLSRALFWNCCRRRRAGNAATGKRPSEPWLDLDAPLEEANELAAAYSTPAAALTSRLFCRWPVTYGLRTRAPMKRRSSTAVDARLGGSGYCLTNCFTHGVIAAVDDL